MMKNLLAKFNRSPKPTKLYDPLAKTFTIPQDERFVMLLEYHGASVNLTVSNGYPMYEIKAADDYGVHVIATRIITHLATDENYCTAQTEHRIVRLHVMM